MARLLDRTKKSGQSGGSPGQASASFDSNGVAVVAAANVAAIQLRHPSAVSVGFPGLDEVEGTAGNATHTVTVPAGKYWRLLAIKSTLTTDATVANRQLVITTRTAADATIEALTHAVQAASGTQNAVTLYGTDDYVVGDRAVAAQGTLTMATKPTEDDTIVLNGVTFTWKDATAFAAYDPDTDGPLLFIGANIAASKAALEAALVDRDNDGVLHKGISDTIYASLEMVPVAFATDDMVFTATVKGTAGNALATTETFTDGSDSFDAVTLGTTTAGVDAADKISAKDWPVAGALLTPGEDILFAVTNGVAGDSFNTYVLYLEYDANPVP
jgi:hypothetical protein